MMRMIAKMHLAYANAIETVKNKKGQNTIEYLFMLGIIVVVVGIVGGLIKTFMPELFDSVKAKIMGEAGNL
ncbi:class III signal peptide-containing protein [Candidatus Proelusimicrobium volucris]|uniref:class III signal peptide-containing protein n=1 Tax=Candidatus Proelusimicrobium volucris TaxID=3416225 RepID=UPI003D12EF19